MKYKTRRFPISKCCNAKVIFSGGGYDGEDIIPISETCSKCGELCKVKYPVGRPIKLSL